MDAASEGQPSSSVSPVVGEATTTTEGNGKGRPHVSIVSMILPHKARSLPDLFIMHVHCRRAVHTAVQQ